MTSKTSFPERRRECWQTYCWALKKSTGMLSLLTVLLFLCMPLVLMVGLAHENEQIVIEANRIQILTQFYSECLRVAVPVFSLSLLLLFALILCIRLFSYMQNKRSVDLFHALPVGRIPMLLGRWCAGITVLFAPLLLNIGIAALVAASYRITPSVGNISLAASMLWVMLMAAAAFTFCVFMAVCSGSTMDTVLSILGVNVGCPLFFWSAIYLMEHTLPGLSFGIQNNLDFITLFAPFAAAYLPFFSIQNWFLPWWLVLTAALLATACLLYRQRKSETAEDQFAFPIPKVIIRFLLTSVGGIGFGLILSRTGMAGFLIGILAGSAVSHIIVEAIYSRGFRNLKQSFAWYAVFIGIFAVFYGVIATGCFGYDTRIPNAADVESVSVYSDNMNVSGKRSVYDENHSQILLKPILKNAESISTVLEVHKNIVSNYRSDGFPYFPQQTLYNELSLTYRLKNGHSIRRTYYLLGRDSQDEHDNNQSEIQKITSLNEYKQGCDIIFYIAPEDIRSIQVIHGEKDTETVLPEGPSKQELLTALRNNYPDNILNKDDHGKKTLVVNFKDNVVPKDSRLKEMLGGYTGKIDLGSGNYCYKSGGEVDQLIQRMGWDK